MFKEFRIAVSFLTRLPLKYKGEWDEKGFSRSAIYFPVVGLIVGVLTALVIWLVGKTGYHHIAAFLGLLTSIVISGGLHLDGFMDMCDGILASRGPERALEIMKDSRVGSFSVIGVCLLLLGKFLLYDTLASLPMMVAAIVTGLTFFRFVCLCCLLFFPCARKEGLAVMIQKYVSKPWVFVGVFVLALEVVVLGGWQYLVPAMALSLLLMILLTQRINTFLGGITGDIQGAMGELSEFLYLTLVIIFYSIFS